MNMVISQEAYDKHNKEKEVIKNIRLRDKNQDFFDALGSVNWETAPEAKSALETLREIR